MAKENKAEDRQTENIKDEKFFLTEHIKNEGYTNRDYGINIGFALNYKKERTSRYASPGVMQGDEFVPSGDYFLTGLTAAQVWDLARAKVIRLKKTQFHFVHEYLKSIKPIESEFG